MDFKGIISIIVIGILLLVMAFGVHIIVSKDKQKVVYIQKIETLSDELSNTKDELEYLKTYYANNQPEPVLYSAEKGHLDMIKYFKAHGKNLSIENKKGDTPLWIALKHRYYDIVDFLLDENIYDISIDKHKPVIYQALLDDRKDFAELFIERGMDVNAETVDGETAFHEACGRGWLDFAELLADNGAVIDAVVQSGFYKDYTPLRFALEYGHMDIIRFLIDKGVDIHFRDKYGKTALHYTAEYGQYDVAKFLIKEGLSINDPDNLGATPLFYAKVFDSFSVAKLLKRHGGKLFIGSISQNSNDSALFNIAVEYGATQIIPDMITEGLDLNYKNKYGFTPLHTSIINKYTFLAYALIDGGISLDIPDNEGKTPLHHCALYGRLNIADALIKAGADVNWRNNYGKTPIYYTGFYKCEKTAELLVDSGAELNITDKYGVTPLVYAKIYGAEGVEKLLTDNDAKLFIDGVSLYSENGLTPLHFSAKYGNTEITRSLIDRGANVNANIGRGKTPLHYAVSKGYYEIAALLIKSGADVNAGYFYRDTPIDIAIRDVDNKMIVLLEANGAIRSKLFKHLYYFILLLTKHFNVFEIFIES